MRLSKERLYAEAASTGFRPEVLEKVFHLLGLLDGLGSHPFLSGKLALKGGTALNLFLFDLPRLSVDIDLNYVGAVDREDMLAERPRIDQAIDAVCRREGFQVRSVPAEHAGEGWSLRYGSVLGQGDSLKVDVNFMYRLPLWPVETLDSRAVGSYRAAGVRVLDRHELAAGKLAALLARSAGRDLFDSRELLLHTPLDPERLRLAFVVYGAMNRRDWRKVRVEDVRAEPKDLERHLVPLLRREAIAEVGSPQEWGSRLVEECRQALARVLPLAANEREFLDRLLDHGEIEPSLLTGDVDLAERIRRQPALAWKVLNVRGKGNSS